MRDYDGTGCVHNVRPPVARDAQDEDRTFGQCAACGRWVESFRIDGDEDRMTRWSPYRVVGTGVLASPQDAERILGGRDG